MRILLFASLAAMMALAACSSEEARIKEAARQLGKNDARELVDDASSLSKMELEGRVLEIRAKESTYREDGYEKAADAYVEAFESGMMEYSDSLARVMMIKR